MQQWQLSKIWRRFVPLTVLFLTAVTLPSCTTPQPTKPFSSEALPTEAIAEISEIRNYPVRVKYINASSARPAVVGIPLKANESVSTEEASTAQVTLRNGAIIRIGGTSNLTLKPQNEVEFASGRLVAWTASDRKNTAKIKTSFGEVSSNDGTIYIEIPPKAAEERRIIALDGTVTVSLKSTSEIVTLKRGEEIRIKADGKASTPKRIDKESIDKRIANNNLIFGFNTQLASLSQITSEFGVSANFKEASTIQFRRSDLPSKPVENNSKVTYSSGEANSDRGSDRSSEANSDRSDRSDYRDRYDRYDQREEPVERRREEPTYSRYSEPPDSVRSNDPPPATNTAPSTTSLPTQPLPITTNPVARPIEPAPSQPVPLEPPPQPVQPEIIAPEPAPIRPVKSR